MAPPASVPVASAAPAANGAAPAAGTQDSGTTETSQDFLLMLGQLLGASPPTPASAAQAGPLATDSDTELDGAALEAMLPFSLATPSMAPMTIQGAGAGAADGVDIAALMSSGGSGRDRAMLESLLSGLAARLGETQEGEQGDAAMFANLNGSTAVPLDEAAKARAALSSDLGRGLHTPVGSSEWADELSTRLTLMAERGHHTASLRLSPEHLGPLEIRISVTDDQASVWFGAAHADTRAAIEQALPRLRELFASQGLTLADAGVSHQAPQDRSRPQSTSGAPGDASSGSDGEGKVISIAHLRLGLVDAYA